MVFSSGYTCSAALEQYGKEAFSFRGAVSSNWVCCGVVNVEVDHYHGREGGAWEG